MEETISRWLTDPMVARLAASAIGILVLVVVIRFVNRSLGRAIRDADARYRARKFVTFLGYVAGILLIGAVFSNQLGSFTVAFGVAGAGIAFALQEVIASVAGWVAISFGNFFRVGDRVLLGGIRGDVIDVGVLRTTLMECGDWVKGDLYNGRIVRIANSFVFKEPVYNYSADFPFLWDEITIPIKYGSDHRLARQIIGQVLDRVVGEYAKFATQSWRQMVAKYRIEDARVEPMISMTADENWMTFTARYVVDYKQRRTIKDRLYTELVDEIDGSDGTVAVAAASMVIQLSGTTPSS